MMAYRLEEYRLEDALDRMKVARDSPSPSGIGLAAEFILEEIESLRAALDAADRFAEMVRQHAAQHAGHHASSDITTVDIRQEYEFYQEALATVGKAGE